MEDHAPQISLKLRVESGEEFRVVSDGVLSFIYEDHERKTDKITITVENEDLSNFDDPVWKKGGKLLFSFGYPGRMSPPRTATIRKVVGFRQLNITAHGEEVAFNAVSKCRTFENQTRSEVVRFIAEENGFGPSLQFIDDTEETIEIISQHGITDAQLIARFARIHGWEFYIDHSGFHFHPRRLQETPVRAFTYYGRELGKDTEPGEILAESVHIENDLTAKPGRVRSRGRNPETGEDVEGLADNENDPDRDGLAYLVDVIGVEDDSGNQTVKRYRGTDETSVTDETSSEAATREARARYRSAQQTAVKMKFSVIGDPNVNAKAVCEIRGMGERLSQLYWIKVAKHTFDSGGYKTELQVVSDGHGGHSVESSRSDGLGIYAGGQRGSGGARASRDANDAREAIIRSLLDIALFATTNGFNDIIPSLNKASSLVRNGGTAAGILNALRPVGDFIRLARGNSAFAQQFEGTANTLNDEYARIRTLVTYLETERTRSGANRNEGSAPVGAGALPELVPIDVPNEEGDGFVTVFRPSTEGAESSRPESDD